MKITAHFSVEEFACNDGTPYPSRWVESRLRPLCEALEILRSDLGGKPILIDSGFRTETYNRRIGGARLSQHVQGRAADIRVAKTDPSMVIAAALELYDAGKLEIGGLGEYPTFTHVDVRPGERLARWGGSRSEN